MQPQTDTRPWRRQLLVLYREVFRAAPRLSLSEWADQHGYLSDGQRWDTSVVPYLREPMDATTDRSVREVVIEKAARVGYTEGVIGQRVGYDLHQDPERVLVVFPTEGDAKDWSQKMLRKMVEASPVLSAILPAARGRDSGNTILDKIFPAGSITIRGAHSPKGLRRHTARDVILDEVDGMEVASRDEGDPVMLATRANRTSPDSKTIMGSTPKLTTNSRIRAALKTSDWREFHMPCPHCEELQVLEWGGPDRPYGVKWAKEVACKSCGVEIEVDVEECPDCGSREKAVTHLPDTAHYVCRHCGEVIDEVEKGWMLERGRWIPRHPGRTVRGYKIPGLLSPFPNASWAKMAEAFLRAKDDPSQLQVWVNQWLGDPYEERGQKVEASVLEARGVRYIGPEDELVEVPDGVGILTAGVDVQHDRLELLVRGYGIRWESWDILHQRIYGAPQNVDTWARLDHFLTRAYRHQVGRELWIASTMVDSGDGQTVELVYRFVLSRMARGVWASKGDSGSATNVKPLTEPAKTKSSGAVRVWTIGTFAAKSSLVYRLNVGRPGPNFIHLRARTEAFCNGFDAEYFAQFGAEEKKRVRLKGTAKYEHRFIQTRERNEAIDLHVLADSAFRALAYREETVVELVAAAREKLSEKPPEPEPKRRREEDDRSSSWAYGWER